MAHSERGIDSVRVEALARIQCTDEEIRAVLGCDAAALEGLESAITRSREQGRAALRRKQFELAIQGDKAMLLVLGRQHLGQGEPPDDESFGDRIRRLARERKQPAGTRRSRPKEGA